MKKLILTTAILAAAAAATAAPQAQACVITGDDIKKELKDKGYADKHCAKFLIMDLGSFILLDASNKENLRGVDLSGVDERFPSYSLMLNNSENLEFLNTGKAKIFGTVNIRNTKLNDLTFFNDITNINLMTNKEIDIWPDFSSKFCENMRITRPTIVLNGKNGYELKENCGVELSRKDKKDKARFSK